MVKYKNIIKDKMKNLNKKAIIFNFAIVIFTIIILTTALVVLYNKTASPGISVGTKQAALFGLYQKSESTLFYIDQSAELSAQESIHKLAENGGFITESKCSTFLGYNIINSSCLPDYKTNFKTSLNQYLTKYFSSYNSYNPDPGILSNNYEYSLIQSDKLTIVGIAIYPLTLKSSGQGTYAEYSFNPSFNIGLDYDINDYNTIIQESNQLITSCKSSDKLEKCIKDNLPVKPFKWKIGTCEGDTTVSQHFKRSAFCITSDKYYLNEKGEFKPIQYKFALDFKQPKELQV